MPDDSFVFWHDPAVQFWLDHLPESLTLLDLSSHHLTAPFDPAGLLPAKLCKLRHWAPPRFLDGYTLQTFLARPPQDPTTDHLLDNLVPSDAINMRLVDNLQVLEITSVLVQNSLSLVQTFINLHTLSVSVDNCDSPTIPLPPNLTNLTLVAHETLHMRSTFEATPLLTTLSLGFLAVSLPDRSMKLDYFPSSLTHFSINTSSIYRDVVFATALPSSLTFLEIGDVINEIFVETPIDPAALSNLKTLKLPPKLIDLTQVRYPPSLTSLRIDFAAILDDFARIPGHLDELSVHVSLDPPDVRHFRGLKILSKATFTERLLQLYPQLQQVKRLDVQFEFDPSVVASDLDEEGMEEIWDVDFEVSLLQKYFSAPLPNSLRVIKAPIQSLDVRYPQLPDLETLEIAQLSYHIPDPPLLPVSLSKLTIRYFQYDRGRLAPQISHLKALTSLRLEHPDMAPVTVLGTVPVSVTDLTLSFKSSYETWPVSLAPILPNLKKLAILNTFLPLCCVLESLPHLNSLKPPKSVVIDSIIFPHIDDQITKLDAFDLYETLSKALLPPHLRPLDFSPALLIDWDPYSIQRLPSQLTSLEIELCDASCFNLAVASPASANEELLAQRSRIGAALSSLRKLTRISFELAYEEDVLHEKGAVSTFLRSCPPNLTSLDVVCVWESNQSEPMIFLQYLPRSLLKLSVDAQSYTLSDVAGLLDLPPSLLHLQLRLNSDVPLSNEDISKLPRGLLVLDAPQPLLPSFDSFAPKYPRLDVLPHLQYYFNGESTITFHD